MAVCYLLSVICYLYRGGIFVYEEKNRRTEWPHNVILEDRSRLSVSGVEDVASFDENAVVLYTSHGLLTVRGTALRVDKLSIEGGELNIEGTVDALQYQDEQPAREGGGFWSRLFR